MAKPIVVQFSTLLLNILLEMLSYCYVLVVLVQFVYVLSVDPSHYLEGFLAPNNSLLRDIPPVTEIFGNSQGNWMGNGLVC